MSNKIDQDLINELLQETLTVMESDTLIIARFTSTADIRNRDETIWKIVIGFQEHGEPHMRILGLILNWMVTSKNPVMLLSKKILDVYLQKSELPRKTCDTRTWKMFAKVFEGPKPYLVWLDKGRTEGGKRVAGAIELVQPKIRKALANYVGGEPQLSIAKNRFNSIRTGCTPVVVPVNVSVDVDVTPTNQHHFLNIEDTKEESLDSLANFVDEDDYKFASVANDTKPKWTKLIIELRPILFGKSFLKEYPDAIARCVESASVDWVSTKFLRELLDLEVKNRFSENDSNPKFKYGGSLHNSLAANINKLLDWYSEEMNRVHQFAEENLSYIFYTAHLCSLADYLGCLKSTQGELSDAIEEYFNEPRSLHKKTMSGDELLIYLTRLFARDGFFHAKYLLYSVTITNLLFDLDRRFNKKFKLSHPDLHIPPDFMTSDQAYSYGFELTSPCFNFNYKYNEFRKKLETNLRSPADDEYPKVDAKEFYRFLLANPNNAPSVNDLFERHVLEIKQMRTLPSIDSDTSAIEFDQKQS